MRWINPKKVLWFIFAQALFVIAFYTIPNLWFRSVTESHLRLPVCDSAHPCGPREYVIYNSVENGLFTQSEFIILLALYVFVFSSIFTLRILARSEVKRKAPIIQEGEDPFSFIYYNSTFKEYPFSTVHFAGPAASLLILIATMALSFLYGIYRRTPELSIIDDIPYTLLWGWSSALLFGDYFIAMRVILLDEAWFPDKSPYQRFK